jgi:ParB family chromosome partitioning protein
MGHARALLSIESPEEQKALALEIISGSLSVREAERLVKAARGGRGAASRRKVKMGGEDANIRAAESKLSKRLEAPVKIKLGASGGVIEIRFSSEEDLMRIFDLLMRRAAHEA